MPRRSFTQFRNGCSVPVLDAKWEEFDLKDAVWTVPAERMKIKTEHKVPLVPRAIEILDLAKQFNDEAIVFPGRYPGKPLSQMAFLMVLRRMGLKQEGLTAHGFRATFKTWAEEKTKFDTLVIEASMAHQVKGTERHYLRTTFFDERREADERVGDVCDRSARDKSCEHPPGTNNLIRQCPCNLDGRIGVACTWNNSNA